MMAGPLAGFRQIKAPLLAAAGLFILGSIAIDHRSAQAADLKTWQGCMQTTQPFVSIRDCTAVIAAGKELPDSLPYAYLYRGKAYAFCRESDHAAEDFSKASQMDATLAHSYFGLGQLFMAKEDFAQAEAQFSKAIASKGEDADVDVFRTDTLGRFKAEPFTMRGFARYKQKKYAEALADYDMAMKLCPTCSQPARNKALVLATERKFTEASATYDHAISLNIRAAGAFWGRGYMLMQMSHYDEAIVNYDEAIRLNPQFAVAYKTRAFSYAKLGKGKQAKQDKEQATLVEKRVDAARASLCASADAKASTQGGEGDEETGGPAASRGQLGLDDAALTKMFSGKTWKAKQGLWQETIEFRGDGSMRQHAKDSTRDGKLTVTLDGAWTVSRGRLCLYTNGTLCLTAHVAGDTISLMRADGTLEFTGSAATLASLSAGNATAPIKEYPLDEKFLPAKPGATAKTLLYFIHGFGGSQPLHSPVVPYYVEGIQQATDWDVIDADFPHQIDTQLMYGEADKIAAASYVERRLKELKAKGYQRIVVGGQSIGGWTALVVSTHPGQPLDATLLVAPACCAWSYGGGADPANAEFANNKIYFDQLIARVRYPTAAIFFAEDEFEPSDRGTNAIKTLTEHHVANLVIDHPSGFAGHGSAWLPVFDYEFRECIVAFLQVPKTTQCREHALSGSDFRTIFTAAQLGDWQARKLTSADLIGRQFVTYPDGNLYTIVSKDQTEKRSYGFGVGMETSSFRDGIFCIHDRVKYQRPTDTNEVCTALLRWSTHEVLALDTKSGKVVQWWVDKRP